MSDDFDFLDDIPASSDNKSEVAKVEETKPIVDSITTVKDNNYREEIIPIPPPTTPSKFDKDIPELVGTDYPTEYLSLVEMLQYQYSGLPKLDYKKIYKELPDLNVRSVQSPTLQMINDEIQRIQAAKERLGDIYMNVERNFFLKKRAVDILESAWYKYTCEKSADKRKGDAVVRISNFSADLATTESCYKVCQHIIKNLDDAHESLSRQITVNQLLLKMNDYGRSGGMPEYDMGSRRRGRNDEDSIPLKNNNSEDKKDELREEDF